MEKQEIERHIKKIRKPFLLIIPLSCLVTACIGVFFGVLTKIDSVPPALWAFLGALCGAPVILIPAALVPYHDKVDG